MHRSTWPYRVFEPRIQSNVSILPDPIPKYFFLCKVSKFTRSGIEHEKCHFLGKPSLAVCDCKNTKYFFIHKKKIHQRY